MKIMQYPQLKPNVISWFQSKLDMIRQIVLLGIIIEYELIKYIQIRWRLLKLITIYQIISRFYKKHLILMAIARIEYGQLQSRVALRRPLNLYEIYIFNRFTKRCDSRVEIPPREWPFCDILGLF